MEESGVSEAEENKRKSKIKVILIQFFDVKGIDHCELFTYDQTFDQQIYKDVCFAKCVKRDERLLHHYSEPTSDTLGIWQFLIERNITVLEQFYNST